MPSPPDDDPHKPRAADDDKMRRQNLSVLVFVILLVAGSVFLVSELKKSARIEACVEARRHDCAQSEAAGTP